MKKNRGTLLARIITIVFMCATIITLPISGIAGLSDGFYGNAESEEIIKEEMAEPEALSEDESLMTAMSTPMQVDNLITLQAALDAAAADPSTFYEIHMTPFSLSGIIIIPSNVYLYMDTPGNCDIRNTTIIIEGVLMIKCDLTLNNNTQFTINNGFVFREDIKIYGSNPSLESFFPYSRYFLVIFDANGGLFADSTPVKFVAVDRADAPAFLSEIDPPPTRSGYILKGWFNDLEGIHQFDFNLEKVGNHHRLYALWESTECEHDWGPWTVIVPATCTEKGKQERICIHDPLHVETEIINDLGHLVDPEGFESRPATCLTPGEWVHLCLRDECRAECLTIPIPALGHDMSVWKETRPATCTEQGQNTLICSRCDELGDTSVIPALGHEMGAWGVATPATCLTGGMEKRTCIRAASCGHSGETRPLSALGHLWGAINDDPNWNTRSHPLTDPQDRTLNGGSFYSCTRTGCTAANYIPKYGELPVALFTVTFVDWNGNVLKTEQVVKNGSATAPADPVRPGYRFVGWNSSFSNVISNITVTALYSQNYTPPPVVPPTVPPVIPPVVPPAIVQPVDPPVVPPEPYVPPTVEPITPEPAVEPPAPAPVEPVKIDPVPIAEESPHQAALGQLADAGVPILTIGGQEVPLAALPGISACALLNLILAILGAVFVFVTLLRSRAQKRRAEEGFDFYDEGEEKQSLRRHVWLIPSAILAVFGIVFFTLTENMNNLMVLLWDQWTIVNVIVFIGVIITTKLVLKEEDDEEYDEGLITPSSRPESAY
jgi:hypothetical protein